MPAPKIPQVMAPQDSPAKVQLSRYIEFDTHFYVGAILFFVVPEMDDKHGETVIQPEAGMCFE
jgi:hypothetical protein